MFVKTTVFQPTNAVVSNSKSNLTQPINISSCFNQPDITVHTIVLEWMYARMVLRNMGQLSYKEFIQATSRNEYDQIAQVQNEAKTNIYIMHLSADITTD